MSQSQQKIIEHASHQEADVEILNKSSAGNIVELNDFRLLNQIDHTDAGNVAVLHDLMKGNLRFVYERKTWIVWNGSRWCVDVGNAFSYQCMLKVASFHKFRADKMLGNAGNAGDPTQAKDLRKAADASARWALQCRNKNRLDALNGLAQRDPRFLLEACKLDNDPWLLGVANGVIDLRTGELRKDSQREFVLKRCPVNFNPKANASRWIQFIDEITSVADGYENGKVKAKSRAHLADYLHKALGYSLTGRVNEHVMFIAVGRGANGKNVLLDTFNAISSDYCQIISPDVLMASKFDSGAEQASPSTRKLAGTRCAISSESKEGQRLDIAVIKRHTGGGSMTARGLHENPMTFEITHKLWLMTNFAPRLDHVDDATKGRLHMIPFEMKWNRPGEVNPDPSLPNANKGLMDVLKAEEEGVLAWLVAGGVKYHTDGLTPPSEVVAFTRDYMASQDMLTKWLKEQVEKCPLTQGLLAGELYQDYELFCKSECEAPELANAAGFGKRLIALGYEHAKTRLGKKYGLKLNNFDVELDTP